MPTLPPTGPGAIDAISDVYDLGYQPRRNQPVARFSWTMCTTPKRTVARLQRRRPATICELSPPNECPCAAYASCLPQMPRHDNPLTNENPSRAMYSH